METIILAGDNAKEIIKDKGGIIVKIPGGLFQSVLYINPEARIYFTTAGQMEFCGRDHTHWWFSGNGQPIIAEGVANVEEATDWIKANDPWKNW